MSGELWVRLSESACGTMVRKKEEKKREEMSRSSRKTQTPMSRRQRRIMAMATAVVMMGLFAMSRLSVFKTGPVGDRQLYNDQTFTVVKVVDGDTLDLNVADHKADRKHTRVRLWGVDTPETKHPR